MLALVALTSRHQNEPVLPLYLPSIDTRRIIRSTTKIKLMLTRLTWDIGWLWHGYMQDGYSKCKTLCMESMDKGNSISIYPLVYESLFCNLF
ncbi:hypothetical protein BRADI_1g52551v3 [Brachypodium distachyon]|uniref:Uncharacterized protein n=1 Tax=Brachypodium distachyon TaxID=15368 RepID=A0A2K2DR35_BRADI|nr:hypothetical protein BRADI_1g52551v3 [Brachypodium distachyon]